MKRMKMLLAMPASACASSSAEQKPRAAEAAGKVAQVAVMKAGRDPNELVCTLEMVVGSHIPERVCRTRWQIEEEHRQTRELLERGSRTSNPLMTGH